MVIVKNVNCYKMSFSCYIFDILYKFKLQKNYFCVFINVLLGYKSKTYLLCNTRYQHFTRDVSKDHPRPSDVG